MNFSIHIFGQLLFTIFTFCDLEANNVREMLRRTRTYADFLAKFNVYDSTNESAMTKLPKYGEFLTKKMNSTHALLSKPFGISFKVMGRGGSVQVIEEPVQSQDSCKVVELCAPLPIKREAHFYYFPECVDIPQCLGGCCDNSNRCQPISTEPVKIKVRSWLYLGNDHGKASFKLAEELFVTMEKHIKCGCHSCEEELKCKENQIVENCKCKCINEQDSQLCDSENEFWANDKCACMCKNGTCTSNSPETRRFQPKTTQQVEKNPFSTYRRGVLRMRSYGRQI